MGHILSTTGIKPLPSKPAAVKLMKHPKNAKQVRAFFHHVGNYHKFITNFAQIAKPLTTLTCHDMKSAWTSGHQAVFNILQSALIEACILHYPDPLKHYIVYTDASDDTCGAQLSQEHNGPELPVAFLLAHFHRHAMAMEHYQTGSLWHYYAVTKWNYYLQGFIKITLPIKIFQKNHYS